MLSEDGEVLTFGEGSQGQLGRTSRPNLIRSSKFFTFQHFILEYMADITGKHLKLSVLDHSRILKFRNIFACGFWTIVTAVDGRLFACGLNNFYQLGVMQQTTTRRKSYGRQLNNTLNTTIESTLNDSANGSKGIKFLKLI